MTLEKELKEFHEYHKKVDAGDAGWWGAQDGRRTAKGIFLCRLSKVFAETTCGSLLWLFGAEQIVVNINVLYIDFLRLDIQVVAFMRVDIDFLRVDSWFKRLFLSTTVASAPHPSSQSLQLGSDHFQMLPSEDFMGLDDYIEFGRPRIRSIRHAARRVNPGTGAWAHGRKIMFVSSWQDMG